MTTTRLSAPERRDEVLHHALAAFAVTGYAGTSTEDIARAAGISQPYLFRLFGTKKELFTATISRCFRRTLEVFQHAAEGKRGEDAMQAIGEAYMELLLTDRTFLRGQMQAYAACDDPDICRVVIDGYGDLVSYVERVSGAPADHLASFFGQGMLLNVLASMNQHTDPEPWAQRLLEGCGKDV